MKICVLTSVHPVFDTRIFHKECRTLEGAGHEVVLVAQHDGDAVVESIAIRGLRQVQSRADRFLGTIKAVARRAFAERADVYHFHDPELISVGSLLKLRGKRVVYDVHEDVPQQILGKPWIPALLRRPVGAGAWLAEAGAARMFDRLVAATPRIASRFPSKRTVLVQNYPILGELHDASSAPFAERPMHLAYVGVLSPERGGGELGDAMALLPDRFDARLQLAGTIWPSTLEDRLRAAPGWGRIDFLGWQNREQVAALLGRVRCGVVTFLDRPNHVAAQPNKLFEYMSAGLPVIASDFPLWREIVDGAGCGLLVDPADPRAVAAAITRLLDTPDEAEAMGRRGREAVEKTYNWGTEAAKLVKMYEDLSP